MYTTASVLIFFANLWAVIRTVRSDAPTRVKIFWVTLVLLLPFVGVVAWILFGPS